MVMYSSKKKGQQRSHFKTRREQSMSEDNGVYLKRRGQIKPSPCSLVYIYINTHVRKHWSTFIKPCRNCKWLEGKETDCSEYTRSHAFTYTVTLTFMHVTQKSLYFTFIIFEYAPKRTVLILKQMLFMKKWIVLCVFVSICESD